MPLNGATWTYSGDPSASSLDAVRFLVQDTDGNDPKLGDEELLWLLSEASGNVYRAGAAACRRLAAQRPYDSISTNVGSLSETETGTASWYLKLAEELERRARRHGALAVARAGGIERADKTTAAADTSVVPPRFYRGQFEPGAPAPQVPWSGTPEEV
jgi:hypothetical protein